LAPVWSNNRHLDEGARRSLRKGLKARLVNEFPELAPIYCGSINVRLERAIEDRTTSRCRDKMGRWNKNWGPSIRLPTHQVQYPEDGLFTIKLGYGRQA